MSILLLAIQMFSHQQQVIHANRLCKNVPNIQYDLEKGIMCLPTDLIFKNSFEKERTLNDTSI